MARLSPETAHSAIVYARADGGIGFWNAGAEALFGHSPEEAIGKGVDLIVPEAYRAMHWAGFTRAIGSAWRGSAGWGPVEGLHKDGERVALEVFLTPIQEADEALQACLGCFAFRVPDRGGLPANGSKRLVNARGSRGRNRRRASPSRR